MKTATGSALLAALLAAGSVAGADTFPAKPVRIVVGIGAGSSMDIVARMVGQRLSELWGQPVINDNRPSTGGIMGADLVAKSPPDGYTLHFCASAFSISASVLRKLPFDPIRDFEPITKVASRGNALVVNPAFPANSVKELIALARAKPGQLSFGSGGGTGSGDHMAGELFKLLAGVDIVHVPYKSGPQALTDVINGQVTLYMGGLAVSLPMIKAAKVKVLATSGTKRLPALPDVPTIAEAGLPDYEVEVWYGMLAPHGTPKNVIARIAADVTQVVRSPQVQERLSALGVESAGTTPAEFKTMLSIDIAKWAKVVKAAKISME
jgi:tripartite-type tricarboxylate transporter receptor subunit TctC